MCTLGFRDFCTLKPKFIQLDKPLPLQVQKSPTNNSHDENVVHTAAVATLGGGNYISSFPTL